ncbi:MAG: DUF1697 domain-containing protein [Chthoniobacterales bacterium]
MEILRGNLRYVAFLRGVRSTNLRMPELKKRFELAGFTDVKTFLSSGNVVFNAGDTPARGENRVSLGLP